MSEESGHQPAIADAHISLGLVYAYQKNSPEALKELKTALEILERFGEKQAIGYTHNNLAAVYSDMGDYPSAMKEYEQSLKILEEINEKSGIAGAHGNLGSIYRKQKKYADALREYLIAKEIIEEIDEKIAIGTCLNHIGSVHLEMGNAKEAKKQFEKSLEISRDLGSLEDMKNGYLNLSRADSALHDFEGAYENFSLFVQFRDSLVNEENTKKTVEQQMQYEFDKKEAVLKEEQIRQDAVAESESKRQKLFLVLVGFLSVAIATTALVVWRSLRIARKQKKIIEDQKHLVEEKQREVLDSIHYARRIQNALITNETYIQKNLDKLRN
jgi:tetratricopeptide (TPR) repeat protein